MRRPRRPNSPSPRETPEAETPEPTAPPAAEAAVSISQKLFRSWKNVIGGIEYQIVVEVVNTGGAYADISTSGQSFTVYEKSGSVLETGSFTYAFPQVIGPNEKGYFVESGYFDDGTNIKNVGKMDPSISFSEADGPRDAYAVSKIKITQESYGSGLQVSGIVKNASTEDASMGMVGVIFFDGTGKILGALYDNTGISTLRAGQSKGFKTSYPGTPPLKPTQIKKWKAFAYDFSFF